MTEMRAFIDEQAKSEGFDSVAVTSASLASNHLSGLKDYLGAGHHGTMVWMENAPEKRSAPQMLWPQARSVIMLSMNYGPTSNPLDELSQKDHGLISVYARGDDYHDVIKKKLKKIARAFCEKYACDVKVFVDTAPVMEKPLSQQAGLGWQGKHTNLVSREFGSWIFLGSIFTTAELQPDRAEIDHCGSCTDCLDICPTRAFTGPRQIDASKCISYLTIEHKGHIERQFRELMGNRIYGCDDCLAVCPWNKFAVEASEIKLQARWDRVMPPLGELVMLDDAGFREKFSRSPIKRIKRDRFIRNVLIAIGNSGNRNYIDQIEVLLEDDSPLVRAACIWALWKLMESCEFKSLRDRYYAQEKEVVVRREWDEGEED